MKIVLLLALFFLQISLVLSGCWPSAFIPSLKNVHLEQCCWYNAETCCNSMLANMLFPQYAVALDAVYQRTGGSDCFYSLASLMCAPCAPGSSAFITGDIFLAGDVTFSICSTTCDNLFQKCNGIIPGNWSTALSGMQLCSVLFSQYHSATYNGKDYTLTLNIDTSGTSASCFSNVAVGTVRDTTCMTEYPVLKPTLAPTPVPATRSPTTPPVGSSGSSGSSGSTSIKSDGLSKSTIAAVTVISILVVIGIVGGIMYFRRNSGGNGGFSLFRNGPQPITAIHPDDDDDAESNSFDPTFPPMDNLSNAVLDLTQTPGAKIPPPV